MWKRLGRHRLGRARAAGDKTAAAMTPILYRFARVLCFAP